MSLPDLPALVFALSLAFIAYAYAGYPLALALLNRLRSPVRRQTMAGDAPWPAVTLLIAAYNEAAVIAARLENALELDYPPDRLQILVAADGSTDQTAELVREYAGRGVELSFQPERAGKMAAINRAMGRARGDIVLFSDANNHYDRQALRKLVAAFADPRVGAAGGAKHIMKGDGALGDSEGLYWRYEAFIKRQESRLGSTTGVCGEILALRREWFVPPPPDTINDDLYLALSLIRRGYDVVYVGDAHSYERVSAGSGAERARRARIVAGRFQVMSRPALWPRRPLLAWQLLSHKFFRPLVPAAMIAALLANLQALVFPPAGGLLAGKWAVFWLAAQGLFYGLALFGLLLEPVLERAPRLVRRPLRLLYLPAFLLSSNLAALAGLLRFLRGGQSVRWQRVARRGEGEPAR